MAESRGSDFPESFEAFYRESFEGAYRCARAACGDRDFAMDAAQEASLRAFVRWDILSDKPWAPHWLARVAINEARRHVRRRQTRSLREVALPRERDLDLAIDMEAALLHLPRRQMEAAILYYVLDLSIEDASHAMDCSIGTVKRHLSRARQRLAAVLDRGSEAEVRE